MPLDERPLLDYYEWVVFFGLYDHLTRSVNHFYSSPEDAEADLRRILIDEPTWSGTLTVVSLDFWVRASLSGRCHGVAAARPFLTRPGQSPVRGLLVALTLLETGLRTRLHPGRRKGPATAC